MTLLFYCLAFCNGQNLEYSVNTPSGLHSIFEHSTKNYTVIFNESYSTTLYINITNSFNPLQLAWRHNGDYIGMRNPRISIQDNGALSINAVEPSDAGNYKITVLISNDMGCQSAQHKVFVECKLL